LRGKVGLNDLGIKERSNSFYLVFWGIIEKIS
jgi:hypothetical protein